MKICGGKMKLEKLGGNLKIRMTLLFGFVILLGCLALWWVSSSQANKTLKQEAEKSMLDLVEQITETLDSRLQARLLIVETIADRNDIRGIQGDRETTLEEKLEALREEQKRTEELGCELPLPYGRGFLLHSGLNGPAPQA